MDDYPIVKSLSILETFRMHSADAPTALGSREYQHNIVASGISGAIAPAVPPRTSPSNPTLQQERPDMLFNKRPDNGGNVGNAGNPGNYEIPDDRLPPSLPPTDQMLATSRAQSGSQTQSVIDAWLTITGNLESEGDVRVDGQICGDIRCAHLVVGRDATVSGDITAEEAVIRGKVKGSIRASRVILQETACVESDIYHKVLSVDEGASFDGQSLHRQQPYQDEVAVPKAGGTQRRMVAIETIERTIGPDDGHRSMGA